MKPLYLRYDPEAFWREYWSKADVDPPEFVDLDIYPIYPTLNYLKKEDHILECGFGGGRVIRHLTNTGFKNVFGTEYDLGAALRLNSVQKLPLHVGDIRFLPFADNKFDAVMAFGVLGGLGGATSRGLSELIRITRKDGFVIVSFMVDNLARKLQCFINKITNTHASHPINFYAWMNSVEGWESYLGTFGLEVIDRSLMISRYNFFHWAPWLRRKSVDFDHARARVCDKEFKLNAVGEALFTSTRYLAPRVFAGAILFVCCKRAKG